MIARRADAMRFIGENDIDASRLRLTEVIKIARLRFASRPKYLPKFLGERFAAGRVLGVNAHFR